MIDLPTIVALMRGLHLAATLSLLGSAGFAIWMLPAAELASGALRRRLNRVIWVSGLIAVIAGTAWLTLQAAAIAGAENLPDLVEELPVVAMHTRYGNVMMLRVGLLSVATLIAWRARGALAVARPYLILLLTTVALGLQGLIGHAGAMAGAAGDELVASEALHLVAAGIWLGALLPLVLSLFALPPPRAAQVCERFTPIGIACVLVLAGTGVAQGLDLIGSVPALFGTRYGHFALLKIGLFLIALVLAALNRLRLTDRLAAGAAAARRHLLLSAGFEMLAGLAIVNAAAFMASSPPAAHTEPVWPFSWQFNLVTVNRDPGFSREVIVSLLLAGGAVVLVIGALLRRRFRMPAHPGPTDCGYPKHLHQAEPTSERRRP